MKKNIKIIIIVLILLGIFGLISVGEKQSEIEIESEKVAEVVIAPKETKPTPKSIPKLASSENTENVTIIAGGEKVNLSVPAGTSFYNALMEGKNSGKITFSGKNYPSLGFFVTDIGTLHAGDGKDLLYYINGKEATVGVSSYILKDGDILEWKLE